MKGLIFGRKMMGALLLFGVLAGNSSSVRAADSDISSKIYGSGKATLRWPDDNRTDNRYSASQVEYDGNERLSYFQGRVSRVVSRDYVEIRASDNRTYRVVWYEDGGNFRASTGDQVEVTGRVTRDLIIAHRFREIGSGYGNRQVDFPATVVSVSGSSRLTVRGDNGRTYTIDARSRLPYNISAGDYVRVIGSWNSSTVTASQVTVLRDGYNGGYGGGYGSDYNNREVDFPGIVSSTERYGNTLRIRGENGVIYNVSYSGSSRLDTGDRVRVVGSFDGYTVRASAIYRR